MVCQTARVWSNRSGGNDPGQDECGVDGCEWAYSRRIRRKSQVVVRGLGLGVGSDPQVPSLGSRSHLSGFPYLWIEENGRNFLTECREDRLGRIVAHAMCPLNVSSHYCWHICVAVMETETEKWHNVPKGQTRQDPSWRCRLQRCPSQWSTVMTKCACGLCLSGRVWRASSARLPSALGHWRGDISAHLDTWWNLEE